MIRICVCTHDCTTKRKEEVLDALGQDMFQRLGLKTDEKEQISYGCGKTVYIKQEEYFKYHKLLNLVEVIEINPEEYGYINKSKEHTCSHTLCMNTEE